jgi:hypothetical protein
MAGPEKDPRFRQVIDTLRQGAAAISRHPSARQKAAEAQAAAVPPADEKLAVAKANQVSAMKAAEARKAEPSSFLTALRAEIEKVMPRTLDEADKFMEGGEKEQLKGAVAGNVNEQRSQIAGPIENATAAAPDPSGVPGKDIAPLPADPAITPPQIPVAEGMPAPKPDSATRPFVLSTQDAEKQMREAEVTPEQLEKANDPRFSAVLAAKGDLDRQAGAAPEKYHTAEQGILGRAVGKASAEARADIAGLMGIRSQSGARVRSEQHLAKGRDEKRRQEVRDHISSIYDKTKAAVEAKLATLEPEVMSMFEAGAEKALADMQSSAEDQIDKFKKERYGWARWLADLLFPVPSEVRDILNRARTRFADDMDALAVRIARLVDTRIGEAKALISSGEAEIQTYVNGLDRDLKQVGTETQQAVAERFQELRSGIDARANEMAGKLAERYKEATSKADEALKKLEEENQGALKGFTDALGEVAKVLTEFKGKLMAVFRKGWDTIKLILADPISFLSNLIAAVKQGFDQFVGNIDVHLKRGFMQWLFGTLAEAGIQIPADLNVWSVLKLVLDVLGLTYGWIRGEAVKLVGERNVAMIEKLIEYISITIQGGPQALWEQVKEDLGNLKEMVIGAIQNWLIDTVIKQAVMKVLSMLNPAGAIVQAVTAIYNTVMWLVENASRIVALIEAVVNSVHAIATGAIGGAASWIEQALAKQVPIAIAFLARLIGLGGLSEKIREFITKVQEKVRAAVLSWLKRAWAWLKKLFGRAAKEDANKASPGIEMSVEMNGASHELQVSIAPQAELVMKSIAGGFIAKIDKTIEKLQKSGGSGRIAALRKLRSEAVSIEKSARGKKCDRLDLSKRTKALADRVRKYAQDFKVKDIVIDNDDYPPAEAGTYAELTRTKGEVLVDGKTRQAHHTPPEEFLEYLSAMLSRRRGKGRGLGDVESVIAEAGRKLDSRVRSGDVPAILVHEETHKRRGGVGLRIHGGEQAEGLERDLSAELPGDEPAQLVLGVEKARAKSSVEGRVVEYYPADLLRRVSGKKQLVVNARSAHYKAQAVRVAQRVAGEGGESAVSAVLVRKAVTLVGRMYSATAAQSYSAVRSAVMGSDVDGPEKARESALNKLGEKVWELGNDIAQDLKSK